MGIPFFKNWPNAIFAAVVVGFFLFFIFNIFRRGGFKAAIFDAKIQSTIGDVNVTSPTMTKQTLKVHVLDRNGEKMLGIEVISKSFGSYQMLPIVLSHTQARTLTSMLRVGISSDDD